MDHGFYSVFGRKKSEAAVRAALETHLRGIWRYGFALSGRADRADDLCQATCLRALERHAQVHSFDRLDRWFFTICRSIWFNEMRAQAVRNAQSIGSVPESELVAAQAPAEMNVFASEVLSKVMALPEAQRETVLLVCVQGYSYKDAAAVQNTPIGTVMSRLATARRHLRELDDETWTRSEEGKR